LQKYPHAPQSSCAIAAISCRSSGLLSASFSRSSIGRAGSCQGKSSSTSGAVTVADPLPDESASMAPIEPTPFAAAPFMAKPLLARSMPNTPAKKPFSQALWDGENGEVSGRTGIAMVQNPSRWGR
jgi:hypothetical protein